MTDRNSISSPPDHRAEVAAWRKIVADFEKPSAWRACWQIFNSVGSYIALWVLMHFTLQISWWLTLPLAILAGGILVRVFIIFHDCGHGSFFNSRKANDFWGFVCGVLTLTPYRDWSSEHARHHATSGDLDRRGVGDIWTLTVQEYLESSRWKKCAYRLARNPFILFIIAPLALFFVRERFPTADSSLRDRQSVYATNFALMVVVIFLIALFGFIPYLIIQVTITAVGGSIGVWMFYVQHQFEGAYWERRENWSYTKAALEGSSFYKLPKVLQWFSGNIGFHHIHHLSPKIPNYHLERCHWSHPMFSEIKPVTLLTSLKSINFRLWDESKKILVGFDYLRELRNQEKLAA